MLARLILSAVAVGITAYFMDVAVVLGLINAVVRPAVKLLSLPLTLLTLGLFALVVNGLMVMLCAYFVDGFKVDGLGAAILFSIILAVVNWVLNMMFSND